LFGEGNLLGGKTMALVKGVNSYCTVAEADELINNHFLSTNKIRKSWSELSNNDKEILLTSTTEKYDTDYMGYNGIKLNKSQTLQFPRLVNSETLEVPDKIVIGYLVLGLNQISGDFADFNELKANGVKSYKIKDASIEFMDSDKISVYIGNTRISSQVFNEYFQGYAHPNVSGIY
jgi:hypothetical protein